MKAWSNAFFNEARNQFCWAKNQLQEKGGQGWEEDQKSLKLFDSIQLLM